MLSIFSLFIELGLQKEHILEHFRANEYFSGSWSFFSLFVVLHLDDVISVIIRGGVECVAMGGA